MSFSGISTAGSIVALPQAILDVYSTDILHEAQGVMMYDSFAVQKTELQAQPGQQVFFTKYADISLGGALTESTPLSEKNMTASQTGISVTEYGNAVGVSEKLLQLSYDDVLSEAALQLGRDYALVTDLALRDTIDSLSTNNIFVGNRAARADLQPATHANPDYFDIESIRVAVELLQTANVSKFSNDFYIAFIHPHQAAYIKRDADWVGAHQLNPEQQFNGTIGRWEDVLFVATTHQKNGAAAVSSPSYEAGLVDAATGGGEPGGDVYRAAIFGDNTMAHAHALPVEMRDNGVQDYGRNHGLAWYSIEGYGKIEDDHGVLIESV